MADNSLFLQPYKDGKHWRFWIKHERNDAKVCLSKRYTRWHKCWHIVSEIHAVSGMRIDMRHVDEERFDNWPWWRFAAKWLSHRRNK